MSRIKQGAIYRRRDTGSLFLVKGFGQLAKDETEIVLYSPLRDFNIQWIVSVDDFNRYFVIEQYPC